MLYDTLCAHNYLEAAWPQRPDNVALVKLCPAQFNADGVWAPSVFHVEITGNSRGAVRVTPQDLKATRSTRVIRNNTTKKCSVTVCQTRWQGDS